MDILVILTVIGGVIGIVAGIIQIIDYFQSRRKNKTEPAVTDSAPLVIEQPSTPEAHEPTGVDALAQLRNQLVQFFNDSELHNLCFDLGIDYENLAGVTKEDKARELVEYAQRNGRLSRLAQKCRRLRPHAVWPEFSSQALISVDKSGRPTILHNLPRPRSFVGRHTEKAQIHAALQDSETYLVSLDGIGGIGKSALALAVAYEYLQKHQNNEVQLDTLPFSGIVWASAKDRELTLNSLLDTIALTLDYPGIAQQQFAEKRMMVANLLRNTPCLLVVDNLETIDDEQVRMFIRDLPPPSKALVTTREQNLSWGRAVSLKGLEQADALSLMRKEGLRLGLTELANADEELLLTLYKATGGAPLAIRWAIGQIKQKGQSVERVLDALKGARGDIFADIFDRSWQLLSSNSRFVVLAMPLFASAARREAVAAATDLSGLELDEALGQTVEMWLVETNEKLAQKERRYDIHPLTRSYALRHLDKNEEQLAMLRSRLIDYYVKTTCENYNTWGDLSGFPWLEAELLNILGIMQLAYEAQSWKAVTKLFECLMFFLGTRGYWSERIEYGEMAVEAARESDDRNAEAFCQHGLGWILFRQDRHDEAAAVLAQSLKNYRSIDQYQDVSQVLLTQARIAIARKDFSVAVSLINESEEAAGSDVGQNLRNIFAVKGKLEYQRGNYEKAQGFLETALEETKRRKSSQVRIGSRQIDLGYVHLAQNRIDEAITLFEEALVNSERVSRQDTIAKAEMGLARAYAMKSDNSQAAEYAMRAREKFTRMGMQYEENQMQALLEEIMPVV